MTKIYDRDKGIVDLLLSPVSPPKEHATPALGDAQQLMDEMMQLPIIWWSRINQLKYLQTDIQKIHQLRLIQKNLGKENPAILRWTQECLKEIREDQKNLTPLHQDLAKINEPLSRFITDVVAAAPPEKIPGLLAAVREVLGDDIEKYPHLRDWLAGLLASVTPREKKKEED